MGAQIDARVQEALVAEYIDIMIDLRELISSYKTKYEISEVEDNPSYRPQCKSCQNKGTSMRNHGSNEH